MDLVRAIEFYQNGVHCEWSLGETYESIIWKDTNPLPKPSKDELDEAWSKYKVERKRYQFKKDRALEMPNAEEQLKIIFTEGFDIWNKKIQDICNKYPAPESAVDDYQSNVGNPMKDLKDKVNEIDVSVNALKDNRESEIKTMGNAMSDIRDGFMAIKGFMMILPEMQKTLNAINDKLSAEKDE